MVLTSGFALAVILSRFAQTTSFRATVPWQQQPAGEKLRMQRTQVNSEQDDSAWLGQYASSPTAQAETPPAAYPVQAQAQAASALQIEQQAAAPPVYFVQAQVAPNIALLQTPQQSAPEFPPVPQQVSQSEEAGLSMLQTAQVPPVDISIRPGAAANVVDQIKFGIYGKTFYGANMKAQSFTIDSIITLQWTDPRVIGLLPAGSPSLTMSDAVANGKIWMPGVEITNRDMKNYEIISTAVTIGNDGTVTKVERSLTTVKNKFDFNNYPVDSQRMQVKIASSTYMLEEVKLVPIDDKSVSGYNEGLVKGAFDLTAFEISEFEDIDGALRKSRGVMTISVTRNIDKYWQAVLVPAFLYTVISWGVFWFPFLPPFIMPRLVLSIISLLTFTNLTAAAGAAIPAASPYNWNDLFCQTIQFLMVITAGLNIFTESAFHTLKCTETAKSINKQCRLLMPLMTISTMLVIVTNIGPHGLSLNAVSVSVQLILAIYLVVYLWWCFGRLSYEKSINDEKGAVQ